MKKADSLDTRLRELLSGVSILPRRLCLETPGVEATVPMLRGTWGDALHGLDAAAYEAVFVGDGAPNEKSPGYQISPAPPDPATAPALDFTLIGNAIAHDAACMRAWDVASGMGIGKERRRFRIVNIEVFGPGKTRRAGAWPLSRVAWSLGRKSGRCILAFEAPLRILRKKQLIVSPTPADLAVAMMRRLLPFLAADARGALLDLHDEVLSAAREIPFEPFRGRVVSFHRWSSSQRQEIDMHGVCGELALPSGPGPLWRIFAAAEWLYPGKGSSMGLGRVTIVPF